MVHTRGDTRSRRRVDAGGHRHGRGVNRCSRLGTRHDAAWRAGQASGRAVQRSRSWSALGDQFELVGLCGHGRHWLIQQRLGQLVEPTGHCTSGSQYSSFWLGLDGYSSRFVEQTGSEVDCSGSTPLYYAWWEMYPGPSHTFRSTVRPGDHFTASVTFDGGGRFTLTISDTTRGWSHTENKTLSSARRSSAEVIVEAPC